jgi:hypothetical protein
MGGSNEQSEVQSLREKVAWYSDRDRGLTAGLVEAETGRRTLAAQQQYDCDAYGAFLEELGLVSEGKAGPPRADQVIPVLRRALLEATARAEGWRDWAEDTLSTHGAMSVPPGTDAEVMEYLAREKNRIDNERMNAIIRITTAVHRWQRGEQGHGAALNAIVEALEDRPVPAPASPKAAPEPASDTCMWCAKAMATATIDAPPFFTGRPGKLQVCSECAAELGVSGAVPCAECGRPATHRRGDVAACDACGDPSKADERISPEPPAAPPQPVRVERVIERVIPPITSAVEEAEADERRALGRRAADYPQSEPVAFKTAAQLDDWLKSRPTVEVKGRDPVVRLLGSLGATPLQGGRDGDCGHTRRGIRCTSDAGHDGPHMATDERGHWMKWSRHFSDETTPTAPQATEADLCAAASAYAQACSAPSGRTGEARERLVEVARAFAAAPQGPERAALGLNDKGGPSHG